MKVEEFLADKKVPDLVREKFGNFAKGYVENQGNYAVCEVVEGKNLGCYTFVVKRPFDGTSTLEVLEFDIDKTDGELLAFRQDVEFCDGKSKH